MKKVVPSRKEKYLLKEAYTVSSYVIMATEHKNLQTFTEFKKEKIKILRVTTG